MKQITQCFLEGESLALSICTSNKLEVYFQSIFEVYFKYTCDILQIYFKYTSSIHQSVELQKKKYNSSLYYFNKRSTFEAHFVKLNQHLNVNLKYTSSIL